MCLRLAEEEGVFIAIRAMRRRFAQCRPHYSVSYDYKLAEWQVRLADGSRLAEIDAASCIIEPYRAAYYLSQQELDTG